MHVPIAASKVHEARLMHRVCDPVPGARCRALVLFRRSASPANRYYRQAALVREAVHEAGRLRRHRRRILVRSTPQH